MVLEFTQVQVWLTIPQGIFQSQRDTNVQVLRVLRLLRMAALTYNQTSWTYQQNNETFIDSLAIYKIPI